MEKYILQAPSCWHQFQVQPIQRREVKLIHGPTVVEASKAAGKDDVREDADTILLAADGTEGVGFTA